MAAIALGTTVGHFWPDLGASLKLSATPSCAWSIFLTLVTGNLPVQMVAEECATAIVASARAPLGHNQWCVNDRLGSRSADPTSAASI